jgi:hypothetical protein
MNSPCESGNITRLIFIAFLILSAFPFSVGALTATSPNSTALSGERHICARQTDPVIPTICLNPPRDDCSFYAVCLESRYHCGPNGYPIGFGQKFCEKFRADRGQLSARGKAWMLDTMQCLQEKLVPEANASVGTAITCDSLEKKAFGTHAECYLQNGLCTLPPSDWLAIVEIVDFKTLFGSWDSTMATLEAETGCLEFYLFLVEKVLL